MQVTCERRKGFMYSFVSKYVQRVLYYTGNELAYSFSAGIGLDGGAGCGFVVGKEDREPGDSLGTSTVVGSITMVLLYWYTIVILSTCYFNEI